MTRISGRLAAILLLLLASVTAGIVSLGMAGAQDDDADAAGLSLPLFGTTGDGTGSFQGTISNLVASEGDGTILLDGTVDGLVLTDLETVRVTGQQLSTTAEVDVTGAITTDDSGTGEEGDTADGGDEGDTGEEVDGTPDGSTGENSLAFSSLQDGDGCDVLTLDIEAFTLDASGDEVDAAPIVYDANVVAGADPALLCSLADLLDTAPDDTAGIVDLLNQILGGAGVGGGEDDVSVETAEATLEPTEEETDATVEPTEEDAEPTEEGDVEPTEEDEDDDKPILTPIDDDATPDD